MSVPATLPFKSETLPPNAICRRFLVSGVQPGWTALDVGCGHGELMADLRDRGVRMQGIEIDPRLVAECSEAGLRVQHGMAEHLPFDDGSFDAIVSSVVIPYTDQRRIFPEFARVLRPGGIVNITCHGVGYGLHYALRQPGKHIYGVRMLANTLAYSLSGKRLPGILGDTLCQTHGQIAEYARESGLDLTETLVVDRFLGYSRFVGFRLQKPVPVPDAFDPEMPPLTYEQRQAAEIYGTVYFDPAFGETLLQR